MPLLRLALRKYPALVKALENRHTLYNETLEYLRKEEKKGNIFVFRPPTPLPIKRICHDPETLQRVYDMGYAQAAAEFSRLLEFLKA